MVNICCWKHSFLYISAIDHTDRITLAISTYIWIKTWFLLRRTSIHEDVKILINFKRTSVYINNSVATFISKNGLVFSRCSLWDSDLFCVIFRTFGTLTECPNISTTRVKNIGHKDTFLLVYQTMKSTGHKQEFQEMSFIFQEWHQWRNAHSLYLHYPTPFKMCFCCFYYSEY